MTWKHLTAIIASGALLSAIGCASGEANFSSTDDDATPPADGTGGAGATDSTAPDGPCQIDCSSIVTDQCHRGVCNTETEQCEVVPADNGTTCDDNLFCTQGETCQAGECTGGAPNDCDLDAPECTDIICNEASKSCSTQPAANGSLCVSSDLCTVNAQCTNGLCQGTPKDCFFSPKPNECHVSECNPQNGLCEAVPGNFNGACSDPNDLCTVDKTCDTTGNCIGGQPKDCSGLTQGCFDGKCDTTSGSCFADPIAPGQQCAEATDDCNSGTCDNQGQCIGTAINEGMACDDGMMCTSGTTCTQGVCGGGTSSVTVFFSDDFSSNSAGWTMDSEWQIGGAKLSTGHTTSCGNGDPDTDHTASNQNNGVAGVVVGGNAATTQHDFYWLTSPVVDVSAEPTVWLEFFRWLNSDYTPFMENRVEVYDGTQWVILWQSGSFPGITDSDWTPISFDLTAYKNANLQVRFGFNINSSGVYTCSQWNIDDVVIASAACN